MVTLLVRKLWKSWDPREGACIFAVTVCDHVVVVGCVQLPTKYTLANWTACVACWMWEEPVHVEGQSWFICH